MNIVLLRGSIPILQMRKRRPGELKQLAQLISGTYSQTIAYNPSHYGPQRNDILQPVGLILWGPLKSSNTRLMVMMAERMWWLQAILMERGGEEDGGDICSYHIFRVNRFTPNQASGLGWASEERVPVLVETETEDLGDLAPDIRHSAWNSSVGSPTRWIQKWLKGNSRDSRRQRASGGMHLAMNSHS